MDRIETLGLHTGMGPMKKRLDVRKRCSGVACCCGHALATAYSCTGGLLCTSFCAVNDSGDRSAMSGCCSCHECGAGAGTGAGTRSGIGPRWALLFRSRDQMPDTIRKQESHYFTY